MIDTAAHWKRLDREFSSALETLEALEAAARKAEAPADLERIRPARQQASEVARLLAQPSIPRNHLVDWKQWVMAETAWLELRVEIHHLATGPGSLREGFLASLADDIARLDGEVGQLQSRSGRFRPRTRVAIGREVERLRSRLDVLREEIRRLEGPDASSDETALRDVGHAWSDVSWAVEIAKERYARPRWRQGREASTSPSL